MDHAKTPDSTLLHNVRMVNEGTLTHGWLLIEGQFIAALGPGEPDADVSARAAVVVNGNGRLLLPGAIDEHVHFRDPGLTHKADMATESRAAVAGGVTSFIDMPNTVPMSVTRVAVEEKMARAAEVSVANYGFFIGATNDNIAELLAADYSRIAGVKLFLGSSTGNMLVDSESTISRLFREVPALIAVHAEDEATVKRCRAEVISTYGDEPPIAAHPLIRSREACVKATRLAVETARATGARLHVLHISTASELEFFSPGPVEDKRITAETCPQYLIFSDEDYPRLGARIKCNPAIKSAADRAALLQALASGVIDVIATDHAPHLLREKEGNALTAVSGMPMIQFSLPSMLTLARRGVMTLPEVVEKMAHNPAKIFGIDRRGFLREGYYADLTLVDDLCEPFEVTSDMVLSRCGWSPLEGGTLTAKVEQTWVNGTLVFSNGNLTGSAPALPLLFRR
ncbi:MAG: dihydroorotase [Bacteroides sp.]|nr:dihydroorotase [Bacteroides sp.]